MQRDVDLVRQLLLGLERRGGDCSLEVLRADLKHGTDERIRHHVRLLVDAGWIKEVECEHPRADGAPASDAPRLRLTHAGQEFIEVARSDAHWREAKAVVIEASGGLPLTLVRALLFRRAWQRVERSERRRLRRRRRRYLQVSEPKMRSRSHDADPEFLGDDDQVRLVRRRPIDRARPTRRAGWQADLYGDVAAELAGGPAEVSLPDELI
jgi:hypothetical protein